MADKKYHGTGTSWNSRNTRKRQGWDAEKWKDYRDRWDACFGKTKKDEPKPQSSR